MNPQRKEWKNLKISRHTCRSSKVLFFKSYKSKNPGYEYLRKRGLDDKIIKIWFRIFARFMELTYELSNIDRI